MLSVTEKPFMLSVIIPNVVMLSVVMPNVVSSDSEPEANATELSRW